MRAGGSLEWVGLRELFLRAHEVTDLALAVPPAAAGLWRILYAMAFRISGLDAARSTAEAWLLDRHRLLERGAGFDRRRVEEYFGPDRFDLFHAQRPFLQDPRLRAECAKSSGVNKLVFSRPSGSNQVWFEHFDDAATVPLTAPEAAWHLIAQVYYGAAGRCTTRTVGVQSEANSTAGPLRGSVSYHPLGANLFESLLCGLCPPHDAIDADASDLAPWEREELTDPLGPPTPPSWPVGILTGRSRHAVLLMPAPDGTVVDAYLTWAWRAPGLPATDPYLLQRLSREGAYYVPLADHTRALWRDLDALITQSSPGSDRVRPEVFDHLDGWLPESVWSALRVRAFGFDQDRQTRDTQWFTATTPPVLRLLRREETLAQARVGELRTGAEDAEGVLRAALRDAWSSSSTPGGGARTRRPGGFGPWVGRALAYYWPRAEQVFWQHVETPLPTAARELFGRVALDAIDHAVGDQERQVRVARAVAQARRRVVGFARKGVTV